MHMVHNHELLRNSGISPIRYITVSPANPVDEMKVHFSAFGIEYGIIRLTDAKGKIFRMMGLNLEEGVNEVVINNLESLPAGSYTLFLGDTDGNILHIEKLQIRS